MKQCHFIGIDTHCQLSEFGIINQRGVVIARDTCATAIDMLRERIERVPRPRHLVIEEGPLAAWLFRNLHEIVDSMTVADPRRNRYIAQEGDKDDAIDAEKLAQLLRGGFVKPVHQTDSLERSVFKQQVALYHQAVRQRVRQGQQLAALLRRHGVMARERDFVNPDDRPALLVRLPASAMLQENVQALLAWYDDMTRHEEGFRKRLIRAARKDEVIVRFEALPGIRWIRAATLYAYLDTPWRFRSPKALWKYLGIGLERRRSGNGPEYLGVPKRVHRLLKGTILGAARSAVTHEDNPFAERYQQWLEEGLSPKLARRNVARSLAATLWGLWKNGSVYRPELVARKARTAKESTCL